MADFVVDASVALKWVLQESGSDKARDLLRHELHAPDFWRVECANALWSVERRGLADKVKIIGLLDEIREIRITNYPAALFLREALSMALVLCHPVYDCLYLALALAEDIPLVTADEKFYKAVRKHAKLKHTVELL